MSDITTGTGNARPNIAFIGQAASGKTTCADMLCEDHGYTRIGFADPLRTLGKIHSTVSPQYWTAMLYLWAREYGVRDVLGSDKSAFVQRIRQAFHRHEVVQGKNRALLQDIGTDIGRAMRDDMWVAIQAARSARCKTPVTLDDCRFDNEAQALRDAGYMLVYLDVPDALRNARYVSAYGQAMTMAQLAHPSEIGIKALQPLAHTTIRNDMGRQELRGRVEHLLSPVTMRKVSA